MDRRRFLCLAGSGAAVALSRRNASQQGWVRHVIAQGFVCQTAAAADFTGQGRMDVISGDIENGHKMYLLPGPDWNPVLIHQGIRMIQSAAVDVDGDGFPDLIGSQYHPGLLFWLERPEDPLRDPWRYHEIDGAVRGGVDGVHGIYVGDIDRDGKPELVAVSDWPQGGVPNSIVWFKIPPDPRSDARWDRHVLAARDAPGFAHYLGVGDVNRDGRPDVATGAKQGNWFAWWEQPAEPDQPWIKHLIAEDQAGATNIVPADVDGDGRIDFIASRGHGRGVVWFEAPHWVAHDIDPGFIGPHALAVGDLNGDGRLDAVACAKDSGRLSWYENDGRGHFTRHDINQNQAAYDVKLVDMNGDGVLDILVAGQESRNVVWYENRHLRG